MSAKLSWGAFWCSKCVKRHAGECPPEKRVTLAKTSLYPAEGSRWRKQIMWYGTGEWSDATVWTVRGFDAAESHTVQIVDESGVDLRSYPRECWDDEGSTTPASGNARVRFVKEPS